jgi:branched-chain amino acid transport system ATP-binding protein
MSAMSALNATSAPALQADAVSLRFGGLVAVDQVSLAIAPATLVGIIGPNGAGKTSLFHLLSGVLAPTAGRLQVGGRDMTRRATHHFVHAGVARTFQTPRVFAGLSLADNVRFGLRFGRGPGTPAQAALATPADILRFVGLDDDPALFTEHLPPTRRRLLEIAMVLSTRPQVMLLDEVAAGLTEAEVQVVARLIRRCRDELGLAVLWIEHAVGILMAAVERVLVMHQGRLLADDRPEAVARDPRVIEVYLGTDVDTDVRTDAGSAAAGIAA